MSISAPPLHSENQKSPCPPIIKQPKYAAVRDWLKSEIVSGKFKSGCQLPSESILAKKFHVSRVTIRRALEALKDLSLVESQQGRGYFACEVKTALELGRLQGLNEVLAPLGIRAWASSIEVSEIRPSPAVREALSLKNGELTVQIKRLRLVDDAPVFFEIRNFPLDVGLQISKLDLSNFDICDLLENELGVGIGFADMSIESISATSEIATHFGLREGDSMLQIEQTIYRSSGAPIEYGYRYGLNGAFRYTIRSGRW